MSQPIERSLLVSRANLQAALGINPDKFCEILAKHGAIEAFTPPKIHTLWEGQGGMYAGLVSGGDGPDYHLIKAMVAAPRRMNWKDSKAWAASLEIDGRKDFRLATRSEAAVLFGNLKDTFEPAWHWLDEPCSDGYAWYQYFGDGTQDDGRKSYEARAFAVRRFVA